MKNLLRRLRNNTYFLFAFILGMIGAVLFAASAAIDLSQAFKGETPELFINTFFYIFYLISAGYFIYSLSSGNKGLFARSAQYILVVIAISNISLFINTLISSGFHILDIFNLILGVIASYAAYLIPKSLYSSWTKKEGIIANVLVILIALLDFAIIGNNIYIIIISNSGLSNLNYISYLCSLSSELLLLLAIVLGKSYFNKLDI